MNKLALIGQRVRTVAEHKPTIGGRKKRCDYKENRVRQAGGLSKSTRKNTNYQLHAAACPFAQKKSQKIQIKLKN